MQLPTLCNQNVICQLIQDQSLFYFSLKIMQHFVFCILSSIIKELLCLIAKLLDSLILLRYLMEENNLIVPKTKRGIYHLDMSWSYLNNVQYMFSLT